MLILGTLEIHSQKEKGIGFVAYQSAHFFLEDEHEAFGGIITPSIEVYKCIFVKKKKLDQ
jgi:hypothetical protein